MTTWVCFYITVAKRSRDKQEIKDLIGGLELNTSGYFKSLKIKMVRNFSTSSFNTSSSNQKQLHLKIFNDFIRSQKNSQSSLITSRLKVKAKNRAVQTPVWCSRGGSGGFGDTWYLWYRPVALLNTVALSSSFTGEEGQKTPRKPEQTHTEQTRGHPNKRFVKCSLIK